MPSASLFELEYYFKQQARSCSCCDVVGELGSAAKMEQQQLDPNFLPFVRTDRYGEGGYVISFWAKARLLLLACTLLPLRLISCLACVASFYATCRLAKLITNEIVARRVITACGKVWSRACLFCLGFVYISWARPGVTKQEEKAAKRRSGTVDGLFTFQQLQQAAAGASRICAAPAQ